MTRVALIGAGGMANSVHYPSLAAFPDVELAALCDLIPEKLEATAKRFGIGRTYADYRRMLDEAEAEAVYILMPPHQLYELVLDSIERGKHVFIEKPPGITAEQCRQMARAAQTKGVLAMCGFNRRYIPLNRVCRERVDARGGVTHGVSVFYKNYLGQPAYYRGAIDILTSDAIHAVDMLRWMCGEPAEVRSIVLDRGNPYYTTFHSLMRFENGSTGVLLADWTVGGRVHRFEMHGKGISAFSDPNSEATILADNGQAERIGTFEAADSEEFRVYYGFEAQSRHFIDCVRSGKQPMTSLADAAKTMELVERIYREAI